MAVVSPEAFARRLGEVRGRIADRGRDPASVRIVAVTKGFGTDAVLAAWKAGIVDVGENYAQELLGKATDPALSCAAGALRWHYLGAIQRNKLRKLAPYVDLYQGVSSLRQAMSLSHSRPGARVLLEVDFTGARQGFAPGDVASAVAGLAGAELELAGLMTLAPRGDEAKAREVFSALAEMGADLGLEELSMGMSDDFEIAVSEGATMVRLGRALFGPRPLRAQARR